VRICAAHYKNRKRFLTGENGAKNTGIVSGKDPGEFRDTLFINPNNFCDGKNYKVEL